MSSATGHPTLFSPMTVGPLVVRNRIVLGAHGTRFAEPSSAWGEPGFYGARMGRYLSERAKGGVGLVIVGLAEVHPTSAHHTPNAPAGWDPACVPHYRHLTDAVHRHDVPVLLQMGHSGPASNGSWSKLPVWAPSSVRTRDEIPKALEVHEIAEVVDHFGRSAEHAVAGGFDGIEVHAAHRYLIGQFLSPVVNQRHDAYGGGLENRMRFLVEVLTAVRERAGPGAAVGIRLVGREDRPGGVDAAMAGEIAARLEDDDLVDFVNVSVGWTGNVIVPPMYLPHLILTRVAATVKAQLRTTPVFVAHRILTPEEAEGVIKRGEADAVTLVRALISDPEWARKARAGRGDTIRKCTGCNQGCVGQTAKGFPMGCVNNPAVGREAELGAGTLVRASRVARVVVVGGGPGGLEAAWVARARGHDVVLLEREEVLGGKVRLAERLPGRAEMAEFSDWREAECRRLGVDLRCGQEGTVARVLELEPEITIVATGGRPTREFPLAHYSTPPPGADSPLLIDHEAAVLAPHQLGDVVVVMDLIGHIEGIGLSELLAATGRDVILAMPFAEPPLVERETLAWAMRRAFESGVVVKSRMLLDAIEGATVHLRHVLGGRPEAIHGVGSVVLCGHGHACDDLYFALLDRVERVIRIGDAVAPRTIDRAIFEGHLAGRAV